MVIAVCATVPLLFPLTTAYESSNACKSLDRVKALRDRDSR
jgi:hypothetical protein